MMVAFIGCDGSGKSTLAENVVENLEDRGLNVEYRHQYNYFLSNTLGNKIRKKKKIKRSTERKGFYYKLWIFVVYPNLLLNWIWRKIRRDEVFVSDRYTYDLMVGWDLQGRLNSLSRFILENFPKPDKIFLTDASPETLYRRKGDEYPSMDFCREKRRLYLDFAKKRNIKIIDTEKSIEECTSEIMKIVDRDLK